MSSSVRIHGARHRAAEFRELDQCLSLVLAGEMARDGAGLSRRPPPRELIQAAFEQAGFEPEEFPRLDFAAPLNEFVNALQEVHQGLEPLAELYECCPDGLVEVDEIELLDWGEAP
jgi:hypothetical protein